MAKRTKYIEPKPIYLDSNDSELFKDIEIFLNNSKNEHTKYLEEVNEFLQKLNDLRAKIILINEYMQNIANNFNVYLKENPINLIEEEIDKINLQLEEFVKILCSNDYGKKRMGTFYLYYDTYYKNNKYHKYPVPLFLYPKGYWFWSISKYEFESEFESKFYI